MLNVLAHEFNPGAVLPPPTGSFEQYDVFDMAKLLIPEIDNIPVRKQDGSVRHIRYKTELCRPFEESNYCRYGNKCQFAHGIDELIVLPKHPKYKTEACRTFHSQGFCPYGPRCHYIHNESPEKLDKLRRHAMRSLLQESQFLTGQYNQSNASSARSISTCSSDTTGEACSPSLSATSSSVPSPAASPEHPEYSSNGQQHVKNLFQNCYEAPSVSSSRRLPVFAKLTEGNLPPPIY